MNWAHNLNMYFVQFIRELLNLYLYLAHGCRILFLSSIDVLTVPLDVASYGSNGLDSLVGMVVTL